MLETVKDSLCAISNDNTTFHQLYINYMMDIQDECLEREFQIFKQSNPNLDIGMLDRLLANTMKGLKSS